MNFSYELFVGLLLSTIIGMVIFYHIIRAAVKSGTSDIVEELRKRDKELVD